MTTETKFTASPAEEDESCLEMIDEAVSGESGIVNVEVDTADQTVVFDYDPTQVSEADIIHIAEVIGPELEDRWRRCTMRLDKHGGRACESCAMQLERQVGQMPGVRRATASFAGGVMAVHYDDALTSPDDISRRVEQFGVGIKPSAAIAAPAPKEAPETAVERLRQWLTPQRLQAVLTVVTFITMISAWLIERTLPGTPGWVVGTLYVIAYVAGGAFGLKGGIESLKARTIDVDLLMVLAALGAAFVGQPFEGAMLLFLFSLSNTLQDFALDRTRSAIRALMELRPDEATVYRGNRLVTLPIEQVSIGDRMLVKPGDRIPLDGVILTGEGSVDQAAITGESMPVQKTAGDTCFAGTINKDGSLEIGVTRLARDSTIARLIQMVEEAQSEKAETQRFIDRFEQYYAIGVIVLTALVAIIPPLFFGHAWDAAFYTAMTVMVAASPCAIVISTPATVLSAIGNAARRGVLFKGGVYVENAATIKVVAFDKTGTLTIGEPRVTDVYLLDAPGTGEWQADEEILLRMAAAVEARSEHPLAKAIVTEAEAREITIPDVSNFASTHGQGVRATVHDPQHDRIDIHIGNARYFADYEALRLVEATATLEALQAEGKTSILVAEAVDGLPVRLLGIIAMADAMRDDAPTVIQELKDAGVERVVMLTGDNALVAQRIGEMTGVDEVFADLLPGDKVEVVKRVRDTYGPVTMVGDGVNDAPALAAATIGIAMGAAGTDVALETADIVLMSDDLGNIPYVIRLSRKTRQTLIVNLGFALFMIGLMLTAIFFRDLPLPAAVIGHEGGTVLVSLNGLRLLAYKDHQ
ncbi:MAG: heavy metal translocating P-type ATPase [Chloroflexota bacterium]